MISARIMITNKKFLLILINLKTFGRKLDLRLLFHKRLFTGDEIYDAVFHWDIKEVYDFKRELISGVI